MIVLSSSINLLASGHDYLYGLLFIIVSVAIGAASKHLLKVFPWIPLPFTVFLLIIGLGMGWLNRGFKADKESGNTHGHDHTHQHDSQHAAHAHHGASGNHGQPDPAHALDLDQGHHGPEGAVAPTRFSAPVQKFLVSYRNYLQAKDPSNPRLKLSDPELLVELGKIVEAQRAWEKWESDYPGFQAAYNLASTSAATANSKPSEPPVAKAPPSAGHSSALKVSAHYTPDADSHGQENTAHSGGQTHGAVGASGEDSHGGHGHGKGKGLFATIIEFLQEAIYWGSQMDPHLILYVFLPILIFEAAFALDMHTFKKSIENAFWLAGPGIVTATLMTGILLHFCIPVEALGLGAWATFDLGSVIKAPEGITFPDAEQMSWFLCMLFGGIISATDPVAVVALLKELGASKKLGTLIEGESLLNDGTAIVAFVVLLEVICGEKSFSILGAVAGFVQIGAAGAVVGVVIGLTTAAWVKRVFNDPEIEIAVILVGAYLTFYAAEAFLHVSGVLGLVALGVVMASFGRTRISPEVEHFLHEFIEFAAFICNVLIFVIVGVVISQNIKLDNLGSDLLMLVVIYVIIHVVRIANMMIFYLRMRKAGYGLPPKDAIVVWWGALRGAIGLALALVVASPTLHSGADNPIPESIRDQFLFYVSGIVLLTLLVNATTIKAIVNALGLTKIPAVKAVMMRQTAKIVEAGARNEMNLMKNDRFLGGASWTNVRPYLPEVNVPEVSAEDKANIDSLAEARRRLLEKEKANYWNQFSEGLLSAQAVNGLSSNVSELLDLNGAEPLTRRPYLEGLLGTPSFMGIPLEFLQKVPVFGDSFSDRIASAYDAAKGFVMAQNEVKKLVDSLNLGLDDDGKAQEIRKNLKAEIDKNRIQGLSYIKDLQEKFPDLSVSIETKDAIRSLLNYERNTVKKMKKQGAIEADEANKMLEDVEQRMKKIMDTRLKVRMPTSEEVLREVTWLQGLPDEVIDTIVAVSEEKNYSSGERLMQMGDPGDGLVVITRGSVKISIQDNIVDIVGRGAVIGEMAVLAKIPRTANAIADTPVTARWLSTENMQGIMKESKELTKSLWATAGQRFAENILSAKEPYNQWSQLELRRWIAEGKIQNYSEDTRENLYGKVAILVSGSAAVGEGVEMEAPMHLEGAAAKINKDSKVYIISTV
jgi:NhaP-type Na+/H+ or K+/H+ antiporter